MDTLNPQNPDDMINQVSKAVKNSRVLAIDGNLGDLVAPQTLDLIGQYYDFFYGKK